MSNSEKVSEIENVLALSHMDCTKSIWIRGFLGLTAAFVYMDPHNNCRQGKYDNYLVFLLFLLDISICYFFTHLRKII